MIDKDKTFSLSHYFDELRRREKEKKETKISAQRSSSLYWIVARDPARQ